MKKNENTLNCNIGNLNRKYEKPLESRNEKVDIITHPSNHRPQDAETGRLSYAPVNLLKTRSV